MDLYTNIKMKREELGLTQDQLAKMVGYKDRSMIHKIEKGEVDLTRSKIMEFARVLNIHPVDLLGIKVDNEKQKRDIVYKSSRREIKDEDTMHLISKYKKLNDTGKKKLHERADELIDLGFTTEDTCGSIAEDLNTDEQAI